MKQPLSTKILISCLVVATGLALFYAIKSNSLNKQLTEQLASQQEVQQEMEEYRSLIAVDSLLVAGEYEDALNASKEKFVETKDWKNNANLRIALAQKFMDLERNIEQVSQPSQPQETVDSLTVAEAPSPKEIRYVDSLRFALEKSKIRMARMERRLSQKSLGRYLTFKSSKGSEIHYVGQVKNNKAHGHGIALFNTGSRYEGEWNNNQRHGEGTFHWPDGEYYVGEYKNDRRDGQGTYYWSNGEKFVGLWEQDKRTGEGVFYGKDGKVVAKGIWESDELVQAHKP
ncbi:MORN repeat-containing protein [Flagellimonas allohymeniacidonis]|nr:hypothetical protein [Allomuricauda hymeniacidonis]